MTSLYFNHVFIIHAPTEEIGNATAEVYSTNSRFSCCIVYYGNSLDGSRKVMVMISAHESHRSDFAACEH